MSKPFSPELITHHEWSGASDGYLSPGDVAKKLKLRFHGAWLTVYMFRRFGPPNEGSDPDKKLCSWLLSTPLHNLGLAVSPYLGDDGDPYTESKYSSSLHFGYRSPDLNFTQKDGHEAIATTISALAMPVFVRDLCITVNGRSLSFDGEEAKWFEHAGYPCLVDLPRKEVAK